MRTPRMATTARHSGRRRPPRRKMRLVRKCDGRPGTARHGTKTAPTARTAVVAPRRKRRRMTARCLGSRTPGLSFSCLRGRGLGRRGWRQNSTANAPLRTHPCLPASGEQPPSRAQERIRGGAAGIQLRVASEARATVAARHSG